MAHEALLVEGETWESVTVLRTPCLSSPHVQTLCYTFVL